MRLVVTSSEAARPRSSGFSLANHQWSFHPVHERPQALYFSNSPVSFRESNTYRASLWFEFWAWILATRCQDHKLGFNRVSTDIDLKTKFNKHINGSACVIYSQMKTLLNSMLWDG